MCRTAEFSAGFFSGDLTDGHTGDNIPVACFYPSDSAEQNDSIGPYPIEIARDKPVAAGRFPVILISHGTGGSPLVYRTLAQYLARRGFVVACPEHPRNNRNNNELAGTAEILENRPRHLRATMDWAFCAEALAGAVRPGAAAVIGHSLGGYTALAVAGGRPRAFARETHDSVERDIPGTHDERVKALVLLAPATVWFMAPRALESVDVPILMFTGEKDVHTPPLHADIVRNGVPDPRRIDHRVVPNAGHFSFLSPFPAAMSNSAFPPSQDPRGFNRPLFLEEMNADILEFLRTVF